MNIVKVRNLVIGEGVPKICVPIVGVTKDEIMEAAKEVENIPVDLVEWRVDWFENGAEIERVVEVLRELRGILKDKPLLFTFRTVREGGEKSIASDRYVELNKAAVKTGYIDLLDVEIFSGDEVVSGIIEEAHRFQVKVVCSNHDFYQTPARDEIISRLCQMQEMGADISKIAVMPQTEQDVITLLLATEEMYSQYARQPIITISMGELGKISRISGGTFGSSVTFGAVGKTSAPGQIEVNELKEIFEILYCDKM